MAWPGRETENSVPLGIVVQRTKRHRRALLWALHFTAAATTTLEPLHTGGGCTARRCGGGGAASRRITQKWNINIDPQEDYANGITTMWQHSHYARRKSVIAEGGKSPAQDARAGEARQQTCLPLALRKLNLKVRCLGNTHTHTKKKCALDQPPCFDETNDILERF